MNCMQVFSHRQGHSRRCADLSVAQIVVGDDWLFEPCNIVGRKGLGCGDCFCDGHRIIRIHHKGDIRPDEIAYGFYSGNIFREIRLTNLDFHPVKAAVKIALDAVHAKAMGLKVQWWGSEAGRARAAAAGETVAVSREAFFKEADIVSLHVRLKPETRGLITAEDLAQMQPRALFVNTARSGLVAPGALEAEIAKGQLHAAVDVFDHEPLLDRENILLTHPNVLATPHIGFVTEDEFNTQFSDIFDQINAYAAGAPTHMINPEAYQ